MLTEREQRRYKHQLSLPEIGKEGQEKLKQAKVVVVGAGGLGSPILQYLTATGLGNIRLIDDDFVSEDNLQRQILYGQTDLGKLKTIIAKQKLTQLNSLVNLDIRNIRIVAHNVDDVLADYNIVVDATDNYETRYLLNDACIRLGKTLVFGSIYKYQGQVSVFNYKGGPSLRCAFPHEPGKKKDKKTEGVLSVIPALVGLHQVNEVIKIVTGMGHVLSGRLLVLDMATNDNQIYTITKNPDNFSVAN